MTGFDLELLRAVEGAVKAPKSTPTAHTKEDGAGQPAPAILIAQRLGRNKWMNGAHIAPSLRRLQRTGYVEAISVGSQLVYRLTKKGEAMVAGATS